MQQSRAEGGVRINPLWFLVWAIIIFVIFIVVMAAMGR
jgi:hypothetical protein